MAEKNKGGRPPLWKNPKELEKLVNKYFDEEDRPTLAGLAYFLGISRSTLYEYDKKDKFSYIIKKARNKVAQIYEERLIYEKNPTGVIFALKNMGWKDRTDVTSGDKEIAPLLGGKSVDGSNTSDKETVETKEED